MCQTHRKQAEAKATFDRTVGALPKRWPALRPRSRSRAISSQGSGRTKMEERGVPMLPTCLSIFARLPDLGGESVLKVAERKSVALVDALASGSHGPDPHRARLATGPQIKGLASE